MSEIAKALLEFQKQAPSLLKTQEGQVGTRRYKYLGLEDALGVIRPLLNEAGIVLTQPLSMVDGRHAVGTELVHAESGETLGSLVALPAFQDMQAFGSAVTYARRYSLLAVLGLVGDEDDDGSKAQPGSGREPSSTLTAAGDTPSRVDAPQESPKTPVASRPDNRTQDQTDRYEALMSDLKKVQGKDYWENKWSLFVQNKLNLPKDTKLAREEFEALLSHMAAHHKGAFEAVGISAADVPSTEDVPFE